MGWEKLEPTVNFVCLILDLRKYFLNKKFVLFNFLASSIEIFFLWIFKQWKTKILLSNMFYINIFIFLIKNQKEYLFRKSYTSNYQPWIFFAHYFLKIRIDNFLFLIFFQIKNIRKFYNRTSKTRVSFVSCLTTSRSNISGQHFRTNLKEYLRFMHGLNCNFLKQRVLMWK